MTDGRRVLDEKISALRLMEKMPKRVADRVSTLVSQEIRNTINAGTDPYGNPWPKNEDGTPFKFVKPSDVVVTCSGSIVKVKIKGFVARHHRGIVSGSKVRKVIPTHRLIPKKITLGIQKIFAEEVKSSFSGDKS